MGFYTYAGFSEKLMMYLYLPCLLNEQGNVDPPLMEKNVFYSKVNESVNAATSGLTGCFPFCVILNLENFYDDERQQCREFGYYTYKHILMKVLDDFEIMINVFTRSI